jgi:hypothetical protein
MAEVARVTLEGFIWHLWAHKAQSPWVPDPRAQSSHICLPLVLALVRDTATPGAEGWCNWGVALDPNSSTVGLRGVTLAWSLLFCL